MKEKTLLKIALICSLLGIVVLFTISDNLSIEESDISKINHAEIGETVKITGRIEKMSDTDKLMFLEVGQEKIETVPVLLFKDSDIALKQGDYVEILGTIEDYEGEREIIANRIRLI